jgi:replicative DNA helicase
MARRHKRKAGLGLIVIDYLQLITPDNPRDVRQEQVAKMTRRLKTLARELSVNVLCISQLNRQSEQRGVSRRPRLAQLRESGAIEQDADVVVFVHREWYFMSPTQRESKPDQRGVAQLIVEKQRNGPTGEIELCWFDEFTCFKNAAKKPYDEWEPRLFEEQVP